MEYNGRIGHLQNIESPWGNAGGVVKSLADVEAMAKTGTGWIEAGSYTLKPREGNGPNGEKLYYHDSKTGTTYNALGMPNAGMDAVTAEIPAMNEIAHKAGEFRKPLIINVAPVSNNPQMECIELVNRAYSAGADAVLLNAGCPNIVVAGGGRHDILSRNKNALENTLAALRPVVARFMPIFVRLSPRDKDHETADICKVVRDSGVVSAVFTPNTWLGARPQHKSGQPILELPGGVGGKSGPATAQAAFKQTAWTIESLNGSGIDVVSSGGVVNAHELDGRLLIGAVAAAGTTFFYESEDWQSDTDKLLTDLAG